MTFVAHCTHTRGVLPMVGLSGAPPKSRETRLVLRALIGVRSEAPSSPHESSLQALAFQGCRDKSTREKIIREFLEVWNSQ